MKYTENEIALLKVMQMNQDDSLSVFASDGKHREIADNCITESEALLNSLKIKVEKPAITSSKLNVKIESFEDLANKAEQKYSEPVGIENLLDASEINDALNNLQSIEHEFSKRTSIINKTDLSFLMVATAIQTGKSLLFPLVAKKFEYGESFDKEKRLAHNDKSIEEEHRRANDEFRDKHQKKHKNDEWINIRLCNNKQLIFNKK